MSAEKLIAKVIELAKANPNNVYLVNGQPCLYTQGYCTNKTNGCLIGQALMASNLASFEKLTKIDQQNGAMDLSQLLPELEIDVTPAQKQWLIEVQVRQDGGAKWKNCINHADVHCPIPSRNS